MILKWSPLSFTKILREVSLRLNLSDWLQGQLHYHEIMATNLFKNIIRYPKHFSQRAMKIKFSFNNKLEQIKKCVVTQYS